jgi:hypothetical protein
MIVLRQQAKETRTRIGQADLDVTTHEAGLSFVQSLLQTLGRAKLDIAETFRFAVDLVLHNAHSGDGALGKELFNINRGDIVVEIAEMGSVRRLSREWNLLAVVPWSFWWVLVSALV